MSLPKHVYAVMAYYDEEGDEIIQLYYNKDKAEKRVDRINKTNEKYRLVCKDEGKWASTKQPPYYGAGGISVEKLSIK